MVFSTRIHWILSMYPTGYQCTTYSVFWSAMAGLCQERATLWLFNSLCGCGRKPEAKPVNTTNMAYTFWIFSSLVGVKPVICLTLALFKKKKKNRLTWRMQLSKFCRRLTLWVNCRHWHRTVRTAYVIFFSGWNWALWVALLLQNTYIILQNLPLGIWYIQFLKHNENVNKWHFLACSSIFLNAFI